MNDIQCMQEAFVWYLNEGLAKPVIILFFLILILMLYSFKKKIGIIFLLIYTFVLFSPYTLRYSDCACEIKCNTFAFEYHPPFKKN